VAARLRKEGYQVDAAYDGAAGLDAIRARPPDLVLLDIMMPGLSGTDVLAEVRRDPRTAAVPVVMMTAKGRETDVVAGLRLGADDYIVKPFSVRELLARVRAHLRRVQPVRGAPDQIRVGEVTVDFRSYEACRAGQPLEMTRREFQALRLLVSRPGEVVTREEMLEQVWGLHVYPTTRTVDNHIAALRGKLEADPARPRHLLTVRGVGYKWAP
jgi:DNA-binding response OmpR family regulator